jgi:hypothetical protein
MDLTDERTTIYLILHNESKVKTRNTLLNSEKWLMNFNFVDGIYRKITKFFTENAKVKVEAAACSCV